MRRNITHLFGCILVLCHCGAVSAAESFQTIRTQVQRLLAERDIPSIAVAVAKDGKVVWEEGFGWADRENRIPATEHTIYSLASVSKPITATGLMTLVQAGKIDLDQPINNYLANARLTARVGDARDATVRRVAAHASGLPLHYQFFFVDEPFRRPSMDETILRYGNLVTLPGEHYQYSNLGYGVLDYVMARVSGQDYATFMRQEVFTKLGLTHTSVDIPSRLEKYQAIRYDDTGAAIPFYGFDHPGASAIFSSAHDLVRFGMFHLKNRLADQRAILSDASIDSMQESNTPAAAKQKYGIGWFLHDLPDGTRVVEHTGGMMGVATLLELVPADNVAVVLLLNEADHEALATIRDGIMKQLLPRLPTLANLKGRTRKPEAPFRAEPDLTGVWTGILQTYAESLPLTLEFMADGYVHLRLGDQLKTLLNDVSFKDGWLRGAAMGNIRTEDANRGAPYSLNFSLQLRDGKLTGGASAVTTAGKRPFALTQWAELTKQ